MKKTSLFFLAFLLAIIFYCCTNFRSGNVSTPAPVAQNGSPILDTHSGEGEKDAVFKTIPDPQTTATNPPVKTGIDPTPVIKQKDGSISSVRQMKKDAKKLLKQNSGDGDDTGIAIGLLLLFILLGIVALVLIIWLIAVATSNAASQSSSNSGSNSNSGNGGGGNGGGGSSGNGGSGSNSGCYIATMVYGDYDAPQVMVLRRFRDEKLSHSKAGRAFINWYYSWSPGFVKRYSHLKFIHRFSKFLLDRFVKLLSR